MESHTFHRDFTVKSVGGLSGFLWRELGKSNYQND